MLPTRFGQPMRPASYSAVGLPGGFEDAGAAAAQHLQTQHQHQMMLQQQSMRASMPPQSAVTSGSRAASLAAPSGQAVRQSDVDVKGDQQHGEMAPSPAMPTSQVKTKIPPMSVKKQS